MRQILIFLCFCAPLFGSNQIYVGGYGADDSTSNTTPGATMIDASNIITVDCTITRIDVNFAPEIDDPDATAVKLKIVSETDGVYTVEHDVDITDEFNALVNDDSEQIISLTGLSLAVEAGWMIGFYVDDSQSAGAVRFCFTETSTTIYKSGDRVDTFTSPSTLANAALPIAAYAMIEDNIIYSADNPDLGRIRIPALDEPYRIILENLSGVGDEEDLLVELEYTRTGLPSNAVVETVKLDHVASADTIGLVTAGRTRAILEPESAGVTIGIYLDPVNNKIDLHWVNYIDGAGAQGDMDVRCLTLGQGVPADLVWGQGVLTEGQGIQVDLTGGQIRRINITQVNGDGATIGALKVTRNDIVAVGDSFVSSYSDGKTSLARVAKYLDDPGFYDHPPYVWNAGITGSQVLSDVAGYCTSIRSRWSNGWRELQGVKFVFVNGPGFSDVAVRLSASSTDRDAYDLAARLGAAVCGMAVDAIAAGNEVVMCGQAASTAYSGVEGRVERLAQRRFNAIIRAFCWAADIPFYNPWNIPTTGTYPTPAGEQAYAMGIVNAAVPTNPFGNKRTFTAGSGTIMLSE